MPLTALAMQPNIMIDLFLKRRRYFLPIMATLVLSPPSHAAPGATVEGLQPPAWVERDGTRTAIIPGMALNEKDQLQTGGGARLLIRLHDGTHVKVGENARLELATLKPAPRGVLRMLVDVLRGAFRYSTAGATAVPGHDVTIRVPTLSIGVRGTDVWGKAAADKNIICLIDGRVDIEDRANNRFFTMAQPLTFYIAPRGQPPLPLQPVARSRLRGWAKETDLSNGRGVVRADGIWSLRLLSYDSPEQAGEAGQTCVRQAMPSLS